MAPENTDYDDWAMKQFLESSARAVEKQSECLDKLITAVARIELMIKEVVGTLIKIVEIELGAILILAGVKLAELSGLIGG